MTRTVEEFQKAIASETLELIAAQPHCDKLINQTCYPCDARTLLKAGVGITIKHDPYDLGDGRAESV